ncbi:MAG TPA: hypothetical protein VKX40_16780 [Aequorivita sp.]|nr:hypothetical protein [Aequorivita sp.]
MNVSLPFLMSLIFFLNGSLTISGLGIGESTPEKFVVPSIFFEQDLQSTFTTSNENCEFKKIPLYGKVKFVESFPDIKIQFVESFPDIKVKFVESFPNDCGKWQIVESFPDFTVQVVTSFPDLKVKTVDSFPGMN